MIEVSNLSLHFSDQLILNNVSFTLEKGETLAIIGESGGGKTSLARLLLGLLTGKPIETTVKSLLRKPKGFYWSGTACVDGLDMLHAKPKEIKKARGQKIGLIAQALSDALNPHLTIEQHIEESLRNSATMHRTAEEICRRYNIPAQLYHQYPSRLSGGEIQRVLSALALARKPDYLILDEPTASLDPANKEIAIKAFTSDSESRGQILITHDLALAERMTDRVAVLYRGEVIEEGKTNDFFRCPKKPYSCALLDKKQRHHGTCSGTHRGRRRACCHLGPMEHCKKENGSSQEGLEISRLSHDYGSFPVLKDISAFVPAGSSLGVVGPSGSGKSTLARLIAGLEPLQRGQINWISPRGHIVETASRSGETSLSLVSQHPHRAMAHHFSVGDVLREAILLGCKNEEMAFIYNRQAVSRHISRLLALVGLPREKDFVKRKTAALSGGEAQRLVIARALVSNPRCLILDEPTSALDMCAREQIMSLLFELRDKQNLALVLFTHDHDAAQTLSDTILTIQDGHLRESVLDASQPL